MNGKRYFLAKTDPETYSVDDLERDGTTVWDGVTNPQALRAIREMKTGSEEFEAGGGGFPIPATDRSPRDAAGDQGIGRIR
jgi:hypothetical protein